MKKIALYGFNNLTKTCSFNIYDICYAKNDAERKEYLAYIDEQYNSNRLTKILEDVTQMIGAHVLNIAKQDYEPQGASVTILISEEQLDEQELKTAFPKAVVAHLDTSHVTVHTYPEYHPNQEISTFRVDIDVSTCGRISPLKALDYLIGSFDSDIITIDYRVRGFTRGLEGQKFFIDHDINSIQNYIDSQTLLRYNRIDVNVYESNIFHTKMMLKELDLENYMFSSDPASLSIEERALVEKAVVEEMTEIFNGRNIYQKEDKHD